MFMVSISTNCVSKDSINTRFANIAFEMIGSKSSQFARMNLVFKTVGSKNTGVNGFFIIERQVHYEILMQHQYIKTFEENIIHLTMFSSSIQIRPRKKVRVVSV